MNFMCVGVVAAMKSMVGTLSSVKNAGVPGRENFLFFFWVFKVEQLLCVIYR